MSERDPSFQHFTVRGLPPDDWPLNGVAGFGLGSRVRSRAMGVEGVAVGAALLRGARDPSDPSCYFVSVRVTGASGLRGTLALPCEDLEAVKRVP